MLDQEGVCIYANPAWLRMTGFSMAEMRARRLHELVHHHHPDGSPYPAEECLMGCALKRNEQIFNHEDLFFKKDGTSFHVSCTASPIVKEGLTVSTVLEVHDITAQKHAQSQVSEAAEAAMAAAEANAKFRTFFEQGSYFAGVMTLDGTVIEANRLCLDACGYTREDVIGRKFWDCGWWNRSPALMDMVRAGSAQAASGSIFRTESPYYIADGTERIVELVLAPVTDNDGRVLFIAPTGVDITERKSVEQRLRLLDAMNQATRDDIDSKSVMMQITRLLGEHLQVTRCAYADVELDNDRFTIRDDWTAEGVASTAGVYSLDLFGSRAAQDMRSGRILVIHDVDRELALGDGAAMFNAIGIKAIICCPLVKEGRLVAMMAVHHAQPRTWTENDIALVEEVVQRSWAHVERVRSTEELARSEAHLSSLFAQTAAGIAEADLSGCIINVNERYCRLLRRSRDELIGKTMRELTHPDDLDLNMALLGQMTATGQPFEIQKRYLLPDGSFFWANTAVSLIHGTSDKMPDIMLAIVLDITERKDAEDRLREADRRKDEFLAMLAHELRNPLAPISAAAELLSMASLDASGVRRTSEVIGRQVRHMTGLVDDLLDVSRVTRGLVSLEMMELDAAAIVAEAVEQVRPTIESHRHQLLLKLPAEPVSVRGDRKRVVQIIVNLLNNAAKYTPPGGRIAVGIEVGIEADIGSEQAMAAFSVEDNGIGMSPELVRRAFDLFAQAERSADRSLGGLGIGLALVKSLVELHGGTVDAFSLGTGRGSRFTVRLPLVPRRLPDAPPESRSRAGTAPSKALKILVVDDNVDAANMLAMLLGGLGHSVMVEHDSRRALERAAIVRPDVCLLDIGLPGMNGNELARQLRSRREHDGALLVAISGYGQEQDRKTAADAGFHHHFIKPVDLASLTELLNNVTA
jgi:PAS domain S-box-containing protein